MTTSCPPPAALLAPIALLVAGCALVDAQTGPALDEVCKDGDSNPALAVSFARDIRPRMDHLKDDPEAPGCASCHYTTKGAQAGIQEGGLDLTTLGAMRRGGKTSGPDVIVPGKPCASAVVQKLVGTYPHGVRMPKEGVRKWNQAEIQLVVDWIAEGARGGDEE